MAQTAVNFYAVGMNAQWVEIRIASRRPKKLETILKRRYPPPRISPIYFPYGMDNRPKWYRYQKKFTVVKGGIVVGSVGNTLFKTETRRRSPLRPGTVIKLQPKLVAKLFKLERRLNDGFTRIQAPKPDLPNL